MVDGSVRLYSVDHADLFITNERNETSAMLEGIPHSLLLSNANNEMSVLVPAWPPCRPQIDSMPFSSELVLDRSDKEWFNQLEHPYYMFPVRRCPASYSMLSAAPRYSHGTAPEIDCGPGR